MEKLIKKYLKKQDAKTLHSLRIECRRMLSFLQKEGHSNKGFETILSASSKLRDTDVMLKICKNRKIRKFLKKRRKKLNKKFIKILKKIEFKKTTAKEKVKIDLFSCKKLLKETFLNKNDKELHRLRLKIKACRYTNKDYEKEFKKIQDALGKAHDYYKCEKLLKKFNISPLKAYLKKQKYIKKAEKARKEILSILPD
ncbi:CHAD domain-containing protein [Nautilia lithotrophica]